MAARLAPDFVSLNPGYACFGAPERRFRGTLKSSASQVTLPAQGKIGGRPAAQYVCRRQKPIRPSTSFKEQTPMRTSSALRAGLIALPALAGALFGPAAYADSGGISFSVIKAGFVIGGSAGSGTLNFHGRRYPLGIGGISYGFTFGASETRFHGTVSNIR